MKKRIFVFVFLLGLFFVLSACGVITSNSTTSRTTTSETQTESSSSTTSSETTSSQTISSSSTTTDNTTTSSTTTESTTLSSSNSTTTATTTTESTTTNQTTTQNTTTTVASTTESPTTTETTTTSAIVTTTTTTTEPVTTTTQIPTTTTQTTTSTSQTTTTQPVTTTTDDTTTHTTTQTTTTQTTTEPITTTTVFTTTTVPEPIVSEASSDFYIDQANDILFNVDLYGLTIENIEYLNYTLVLDDDYNYDNNTNVLTLYGSLLVRIYDQSISDYIFSLKTIEGSETEFDIKYDLAINRILNGGFETGDLFGWTSYALWKDESGMTAFINERVVSTPNYGSDSLDPYNQEGNYHFGLYVYPYDNANKDLNQERMGMLKSSDFILDGSGFISFRLGGGKNQGTAYVSVHDAVTHEELARYGNTNFGNTELSQTSNAEGYMFEYYADLSAYLGRELYILIVDAASHEWSVLAFDSFNSYYVNEPVFDTHQEAINILPNIANTGLGLTTIANGSLSTNLDGWENPQAVFTISNGGAISSVGGNGALGVLRSSAFTISGDEVYLTFDFAGAIKADKQVFILVKEVGTNLEVLRLTRRADLGNYPDSGDFHYHWYDLSSLSRDKEYYLEIVDNKNGDWGVALVRNFALVTSDYGEVYQEAVNAYYGFAIINPNDSSNRKLVNEIENGDYSGVINMVITPGEDMSDGIGISYLSDKQNTVFEYSLKSDTGFVNSISINLEGLLINDSGGLERYLFQTFISDLEAGAEYNYYIYSGGVKSSLYSFSTAPVNQDFRFLYVTDTQALTFFDAMITKSLLEQAMLKYSDYLFLLHTGDIVERGASQSDWNLFFQTNMSQLPVLSVIGNHDYHNLSGSIHSPDYYNQTFNNPKNGIEEYYNTSYYVMVDNVLFIMIDVVTAEYFELQQDWFLDVIANNPADYTIACAHYSPYGTYHESSAAEMITNWGGVFDQANIDLVITGHDHIYARTPSLVNGQEATNPDFGTVYFIGGTGSYKFRYVEADEGSNFDYYVIDTEPSISIITVTDTEILIESINLAGEVFDSFTIPKK